MLVHFLLKCLYNSDYMKNGNARRLARLMIQYRQNPTRVLKKDIIKLEQEFDVEHAFYSSALEGVTGVTLDEVKKIFLN